MKYPGRVVRAGESTVSLVKAVQRRLEDLGLGPVEVDGVFGAETEASVKMFQSQRGLVADGLIGPQTWGFLFPAEPIVRRDLAPTPLLVEVVAIARSQIGVREVGGPNRGPEVEAYLASVGLGGGNPWCMAFVYWCFGKAAAKVGGTNPCVKTGLVMGHWQKATSARRVSGPAAYADPSLVQPGWIFMLDHGGGKGHTGIVAAVEGGELITIEGNTNTGGAREGIGVFERRRTLASIGLGYLRYDR